MKIYTKKGDKGKTSLGSGIKVWKDSQRVESYGTIDELNALIGVVGARLLENKKGYAKYLKEITDQIQDDLFCIGSYLSNPANGELLDDLERHTESFEHCIDEMTEDLPELENFILPGGTEEGALFQLARTVCRRAERNIVSLMRDNVVNEGVVQYVNRLSDLLFTMSRFANHNEHVKEIIWKRR